MQIQEIFDSIVGEIDFVDKDLPTGAKSFLILSFFKRFNKIIFISKDAEIIYDEIKSIRPEGKVLKKIDFLSFFNIYY